MIAMPLVTPPDATVDSNDDAPPSTVPERRPETYGLSYSERTGFEVLPHDRHGRPIHFHPLGARTYATPAEAYSAIRAFEERGRHAA